MPLNTKNNYKAKPNITSELDQELNQTGLPGTNLPTSSNSELPPLPQMGMEKGKVAPESETTPVDTNMVPMQIIPETEVTPTKELNTGEDYNGQPIPEGMILYLGTDQSGEEKVYKVEYDPATHDEQGVLDFVNGSIDETQERSKEIKMMPDKDSMATKKMMGQTTQESQLY